MAPDSDPEPESSSDSDSGSGPVLVPVQLEAFVLNPTVCGTGGPDDKGCRIAPIIQPNYTFLRLDNFLLQSDVQNHADLHSSAPAGLNSRLTDLGARPPKYLRHRHGVYIHWSLPRLYRSGLSSGDSVPAERRKDERLRRGMDLPSDAPVPQTTTPEFTEPPTRWVVMRKLDVATIKPEAARAEFKDKEYQAWVIESDYLWSLDKIPLEYDLQTDMAPFVVGQPGSKVNIEQQAEVFIGRKYTLEEWSGRERPDATPPNISLLRSSNQLFADFQMHNANVFSMLDNFKYGDGGKGGKEEEEPKYLTYAKASYYLLGWHWKDEVDPLWRSGGNVAHAESFEALFMSLVGGGGGSDDAWLKSREQVRLLCHGAMYDVVWDHDNKPADVPADRFAKRLRDQVVPSISVGTTPMDALVSYCSARKGSGRDPPSIHKMEEDILAIYSLLHARDDGVEGQREAKDTVYNWSFTRGQGGTHYFLSGEDADGQPLKPNANAVRRLRELNQTQGLLDSCNRTMLQYRWDMFSCWWKYVSDVSNKKDELQNQKFTRETDAIAVRIDKLEARVDQLQGDVDGLLADHLLTNAKPGTEPFYYRARDPTVLVGGIEPGWASDHLDKVNVRLPRQVIPLGSGTDLPTGLRTLLSLMEQKLPPQLQAAAEALASEFYALRPVMAEGETGNEAGSEAGGEAGGETGGKVDSDAPPEGKQWPQFHDQKGAGRWRDRWGNRQPWFPLYAEWEVEYTHVPWEYWKLDEQTARLSANKLVRYGVTVPSGKTLWEELNDLRDPKDPKQPANGRDTRILSGRVLILPQPSFSLSAKVQQLFSNTPPAILDKALPKEDRDRLLANINQLSYLSSPLAGLTDGLLTLSQGSHIKPENKTVGSDGESSDAIGAAVFDQAGFTAKRLSMIKNNSALTPFAARTRFADNGICPFKPVTHGQFCFRKFNIIDKFGQTLMAIDQEPKVNGPDPIYPCISDFYEPQAIKVDDEDHANTVTRQKAKLCEFMQLPPQINQNARLNAAFVRRVADDPPDTRVSGLPNPAKWRPATEWESPIWGWIITNYADYGIQIFHGDGTFYREVRFGGPLGALAAPKWIPFAPGDRETRAGQEADMKQLDLLVARLADPAYLAGFWRMITTAQDNLPAAPTAYAQFLNSIVGKPLALVNMGWSLELDGPPLTMQLTNGSTKMPERMLAAPTAVGDTSKFYQFQVKLGDKESEYDGLVGYFDTAAPGGDVLNLDYINTFFGPGAKEPAMKPLKPLGAATYPLLTPFWQPPFPTSAPFDANSIPPAAFEDRRNGRMSVFGAIVDPFTPVHAYSSFLPPKTLQLPSWTWQGAMNNMTAFFHAGPLTLVDDVKPYDPSRLLTSKNWRDAPPASVALPSLRVGEWNWLQPYVVVDPAEAEVVGAVADVEDEGDDDDDEDDDEDDGPVFNSFGIETKGNLNQPGFQNGPYTAVEGFLQLRNPIMMPKPPKA